MWQLILCTSLSCSYHVDTGEKQTLELCKVTANIMVHTQQAAPRAMCHSTEDTRAWATDWGWDRMEQFVR